LGTAISLFTGVGGLDFGLEVAGFRTTVAIERDAAACATIIFNRKWPVVRGGVRKISSAEILAKAQLRPGQADLLSAGPPCQPFSKSAYWVNGDTRRMRDARADTLRVFLRVLRDTRPRTFMLENVHGLAGTDG
jgi:DNA (cytosine-5)-methyltransferase 1